MIIIMSSDKPIMLHQQKLAGLYSAEVTTCLNVEGNYLLKDDKLVLEQDGSLPKRISFIGHAHDSVFGELSASDFAALIIKELDKACVLDPRLLDSLKTIDLIGCEIGLVNSKGESYAQSLADSLYAAGYDLSINAFSNLAISEEKSCGMRVRPSNYVIFKTEEAKIQYEELIEAGFRSTKRELRLIQEDLLQIRSYEHLPTEEYTPEISALLRKKPTLEQAEQEKLQKISLLGGKVEEIISQTEVIFFTDPRAYLDENPGCHFSPRLPAANNAIKLEKIQQKIDKTKKLKTELQNILALDDSKAQKAALLQFLDHAIELANKTEQLGSLPMKEKIDATLLLFQNSGINVSQVIREGNTMENFVTAWMNALDTHLELLESTKNALITIETAKKNHDIALKKRQRQINAARAEAETKILEIKIQEKKATDAKAQNIKAGARLYTCTNQINNLLVKEGYIENQKIGFLNRFSTKGLALERAQEIKKYINSANQSLAKGKVDDALDSLNKLADYIKQAPKSKSPFITREPLKAEVLAILEQLKASDSLTNSHKQKLINVAMNPIQKKGLQR